MLNKEKKEFENNNKVCIVAGNGPSLAEIDYERLPSQLQYDVFRCNQFYFEDKYYLGKKVKFAFATSPMIFEQSYTYKNITLRHEYEIDNIVVSDFDLHIDNFYKIHETFFSDIVRGSMYLSKLNDFFEFIRHNEVHKNKRITSGIYMCAFAVALGYKNIYIAGIDLYSTKKTYAFNSMRTNLLTIRPDFNPNPYKFHSMETDIEALQFLVKNYEAKFYSICPNSPLNKYIILADLNSNFILQSKEKPQDSIKDMLIPNKSSYEALNVGVEEKFHKYQPQPIVNKEEEIKREEQKKEERMRQIQEQIGLHKSYIKNNSVYILCGFIYKFINDIMHLPRDIKRFMQGCKIYKETLEKSNTKGGGGGIIASPYTVFTTF